MMKLAFGALALPQNFRVIKKARSYQHKIKHTLKFTKM